MPIPAVHSSSEGQTRPSFSNAYRAEVRMRPIESISVPSRSKRTVGRRGPAGAVAGMAVDKVRGYHGRMTASNSRAEQKKNLIALIVMVAVLDVIMIGIYTVLHVADRSVKSQQTFVAIWV